MDPMTADTLNRLCAEHVAGWKKFPAVEGLREILFGPNNEEDIPDYVNDPAAVLALLEQSFGSANWTVVKGVVQWSVQAHSDEHAKSGFATAPTFAEAGVRALLKAHGCEVGE